MLVAGIMSGTSADAIDVALVEIRGRGWKTRYRLVAFHSVKYPAEARRRVLAIAGGAAVPAGEIACLNFLLGELFAKACSEACRKARISLRRLRLIGSHGQTIFHQGKALPFCGAPVRATFQIGEPAVIAARTGVDTVADFRPADMALGGQGAPLVPYFDYLTYRHAKRGRVVLNIGGIANLTAIPAGGAPADVIAFDTGPGNMLIDALAAHFSGGRRSFDAGGEIAASGAIDDRLIAALLEQAYFHVHPPKSAGREEFGALYLKQHFMRSFGSRRATPRNALATATAFTAESIAQAIKQFVVREFRVHECIASGGGTKNRYLMKLLQSRLAAIGGIRLTTSDGPGSDGTGVPSHAKEAMAFAVLAYQTHHGEPSNLPSATGASRSAVLGKVIHAG
jgi:anhydro-N-acetylmuramic acid kinase